MSLPDRLLFVDVETTGLFSSDRVVSLGIIDLDTRPLREGRILADSYHLVFDPGRKSHPRAEAVHGWSDWVLRHQDPFSHHAASLLPLFESGASIVAHNAGFDWKFIAREFELAETPLVPQSCFCTMQAWRDQIGGKSSLDAVLREIGLQRSAKTHGALEDAWLAMQVYLWLHGVQLPADDALPRYVPSNLKAAPQQPPGPLPRRKPRRRSAAPTLPKPRGAAAGSEHEPTPGLALSDESRKLIMAATRPTAALMLWVARADGVTDDSEVAAVASLVGAELGRLGLPRDADIEQDLAAEFFEIEPTPQLVDAAARVLVRDERARAELTAWLRLVMAKEEKASPAERDAIARIGEAFKRSALP